MPAPRGTRAARRLHYRLAIPRPETHRVEIELTVGGFARGPAVFCLPAWSPGSYKVRDYCRNIIRLEATDTRGRKLTAVKRDKNTWVVERRGAATIRLRYEVYCNDKTVRTCHVDDRHAFLTGPALFFHVEGQKDRPIQLDIAAPREWRVSTGMEPHGRTGRSFRMDNYDDFVDCPLEIGRHDVHDFTVLGKPHRFAIYGQAQLKPEELLRATRRIIEVEAALFGGLPYRHYTFLLDCYAQGGGGLEHKNSCALITPRFGFHPRGKWLQFLGLVAHEFFHCWNVKRIRPDRLGPFDYSREVHTRLLWVMEGFTSYYDQLILRRAGLMSRAEYLGRLSEQIQRIRETPGRHVQSLEDASFDSWVKFYQQDENTPNTAVSYYEKGSLVALLLDLEIRRRTDGRRSLDDLMRLLWRRFGARDRGFPEDAMQRLAEEVAGGSLQEFFDRFVRGTAELPFEDAVADFGLLLVRDHNQVEPTLGIRLTGRSGPAIVASVLSDGPGYRDGLNARDEIVALDGFRVDAASLTERLARCRAKQAVNLTLFRDEHLRSIRVLADARIADSYRLRVREEMPADVRARLEAWLGVDETAK